MKVFVGDFRHQTSVSFLALAYKKLYNQDACLECIVRNDFGKPFFKDEEMPFFSISHSGRFIVCSFDECEIGIDIQRIRPIPKNIIKRFLKYTNKNDLKLIEEWTKFESYGKKMGMGIPFDMDYANGHFLTTFEINDYVVTVCTDNKNEKSLELVYL